MKPIVSDSASTSIANGDADDNVMQHLGALNEATEHLKERVIHEDVDPETVGKWITLIGKAILAIFKP